MSGHGEPGAPGDQSSLYDHALRLHRLGPDAPLSRDGMPYPDEDRHRRGRPRNPANDQRGRGKAAAAILDAHFARPSARPADLVWAFHEVDVPIHRNEHISAAALRTDPVLVRRTGRWLIRHSPDRCSVLIGLALLATEPAEEDIPLVRTIGLLSDTFGALAADALERRRDGTAALLWLAERVGGWGRVYVVEALCRRGGGEARSWLLRRACDGDFLNGYFAGRVATAAHLHEAITGDAPDDELIDHTGRLLAIMAGCGGMGMTWDGYPPVRHVLAAHAGNLAGQRPSWGRYSQAAHIADHLAGSDPGRFGLAPGQRDGLLARYLDVLRRAEWSAAARAAVDSGAPYFAWFASTIAARLGLPAFADSAGQDDGG
ncbi:hypothetical protein [Actinomadura sp. NPDC048394]|uniref:hypothetical protein n=1 Tax=Actinomadura sp. NPDC048394 TaxID=3158223 RepID=UPI0033C38460